MRNVEYVEHRIKLIALISTCMLALILLRLINLQIYSFARFFSLGQRNFLRTEKTATARGSILDVKGRPLATSRALTALYWSGTGNSSFSPEQQALIEHITRLLPSLSTIFSSQEFLSAERRKKRFLLAPEISFKVLSALTERYPTHPNIVLSTHFKRVYPYKQYACHVLGYLGSLSHNYQGQMGLERIHENVLRGKLGTIRKTVNSKGHVLAEEELEKPIKGQDLKTTLDLDLQKIAEDIFPSAYAGVMLGLSPTTGAIKFTLSRPGFNPNMFLASFDEKSWTTLKNQKQPFINRAFNALYPPASLFKLVTISAALEQGLITREDVWTCTGSLFFGGRRYYCNNRTGHGEINPEKAVAVSCNIPFYEIAKNIKIDILADYAYRFGLGSKTGTSLPEERGLVPTTTWKLTHKKERWWPGETLSAAIGQSFLLVTPLQLARMVSAICSGYFVKPSILISEIESQEHHEPLDLKPETQEFLKDSMRMSVRDRESGTSRTLGTLSKDTLTIYAKTGTAQTSGLDKRHKGEKYREHGWFVAYIQYKNHEPITLLVLLEHAGSSRYAIEVAQQFLKRYCPLLDSSC